MMLMCEFFLEKAVPLACPLVNSFQDFSFQLPQRHHHHIHHGLWKCDFDDNYRAPESHGPGDDNVWEVFSSSTDHVLRIGREATCMYKGGELKRSWQLAAKPVSASLASSSFGQASDISMWTFIEPVWLIPSKTNLMVVFQHFHQDWD